MEKDKVISGCALLIIGGSAGSLEVLMAILPRLTRIPTFAIAIVLHRKSTDDTLLEDLMAAKTLVPVTKVEDKTPLLPGFIYIAPSDYHLLFEKDRSLSLDTSDKINYSRPSIDVSFESAADVFGRNVVCILLSGANADGTKGMQMIKNAGGTIVVQKPESAEMPFMPQQAIIHAAPDYILDVAQLLNFIETINI